MKILAFAGSNSRNSINRQLATYAADLAAQAAGGDPSDEVTVEILDINDFEMPIYSVDREAEVGVPAEATAFYETIGAADALIISFAEHNGHYPAAYKNLFDWTSRIDIKVYQDKPTLLLATSPGPGGGGSVLGAALTSAPFFGNDVRGSLSVPAFFDNFDAEQGRLTNDDLDSELRSAAAALVRPATEAEVAA